MNGLSLVALIVIAIACVIAYRLGRAHARRDTMPPPRVLAPPAHSPSPSPAAEAGAVVPEFEARVTQLEDFAEDRRRLYRELAQARADTARYRQIVVDIENNAPPPILGERGTPDDLKLIVGIGPVLERMLQQIGVATYRQIARWTERDIDAMDARLHEFPGRIRRDAWVVQARALHQSKYGENP